MPKEKPKTSSTPSKTGAGLPMKPWITMKSGIIIISITSLVMAVLTAIQAVPVKGWIEGLLWGLLFGALIWAIFFGMLFVNRFLRR